MSSSYRPDTGTSEHLRGLEGVDKHFYQNQVPPSSPFDDKRAFAFAAAVAKDKARHELIKAVRKAEQDAISSRSVGQQLADAVAGRPGGVAKRSIDGADGASDDAIKL